MTHPHGTALRYLAGCRTCDDCRQAWRAYQADWRRARAYGRVTEYVDAQPVRDHLATLSAAGIGWQQAARLAGVTPSLVERVLYGTRTPSTQRSPSRRMKASNAAAILSVTPDQASDRTRVDATGTRRRIQALMVLGWPIPVISERADVGRGVIDGLLHSRRTVYARTARAIAALYDELSMRQPTSDTGYLRAQVTRTRKRATASGWAPPLAWDEIDNRKEHPKGLGARAA